MGGADASSAAHLILGDDLPGSSDLTDRKVLSEMVGRMLAYRWALFGTLILMLGGAAADALVAVQIGSMVDQLTRLAHSDAEQQPPSGDALALPVASSSLDTALALLAGLSIAQALAHFARLLEQ